MQRPGFKKRHFGLIADATTTPKVYRGEDGETLRLSRMLFDLLVVIQEQERRLQVLENQ